MSTENQNAFDVARPAGARDEREQARHLVLIPLPDLMQRIAQGCHHRLNRCNHNVNRR